ncbi:hypothetical protein, partial [Daejeonella sp.]|uniref:hypothetical protein n=1 Tax=Daejeonella sp. TaxID=2805397 RepID=UPI0030BB4CC9
FDQVKSNSNEGHIYSWLFHAPQNAGNKSAISYQNQRMIIEKPNARLSLDVVSPEIHSAKIRERNVQNESFISLASKPNQSVANFLAVILPEAKPVSGTYGPQPAVTRVEAPGWIGARVEHHGVTDMGFFQTGEVPAGTVGGFITNAKRFTASLNKGGDLVKVYFEGSKFAGSGLTIQSDLFLTCAMEKHSGGVTLEVQSDKPGVLTISSLMAPARISLNGVSVKLKYNTDSKVTTLLVPKGKNEFFIE